MLSQYLIAAVVGVMLFFSVAVAPTVFKVLPQEWSSKYVRAFFPKYYAVLAAVCVAAGLWAPSDLARWVALSCAVLFVFSLLVLTPAINRASDARNKKQFAVLHIGSVAVNLVQLAALMWLLWRELSA
jgi:diacylglycerol kinase